MTGTVEDEAGQVIEDEKFSAMSFGYAAKGWMVEAAKANRWAAWAVYEGVGDREVGAARGN